MLSLKLNLKPENKTKYRAKFGNNPETEQTTIAPEI